MPSKTKNVETCAVNTNDLDAFTSTGRPTAPHRTMIYGPGGTGKSTFCAECPDVYFLPTDEGVNQIRVPQWKTRITSLDILYRALDLLRDGKHPYRAVALDTVGDTEKLICSKIEERLRASKVKGPKTIAEMNDDYGAGHVAIADEWRILLGRLDELRDRRDMTVFLLGHSKAEQVNNLEGKDYTHFTIDLGGRRSAKLLINWCDDVLFARQDVLVSVDNKKVMALRGGLHIYTRPTASFDAKTRGEIPWPERLPLNYATFATVRDLIAHHGKDIASHLYGRLVEALKSIDTTRRELALSAFERNANAGQWHIVSAIVEQAESEARGDDSNASNSTDEESEL